MNYGAYVTVRYWCPVLFNDEDLKNTGKSAEHLATELFREESVGLTGDEGEIVNVHVVERDQ